ncbi:class III lanthionine synthetase LanKC [Microtetraspora sp. AC03309]|uniref:class III lanthionine synthetase LanKC n=1 Tax=Microtetraspora sp. AC03309 TaxID=2779376 RepID=UPI001E514939|nr:class III lanthionine synthetase LanKC [Microtetraspora sp. AC03309]MCC5581932.1 class III lanthionine synthetase LanKC [Microtetraspora sp. AC03309]
MDDYELYCLADSLFYDTPDQKNADSSGFSVLSLEVPDSWFHQATDTWMYYAPVDVDRLPSQGWKIHVSACLADAERAVRTVWDYCLPRNVAFKFLRSESVLVMHNSKAASRASSGKLVTIYPQDEAQLELVLSELDELLRGVEGPYILSDLRYGDGPLFVRYGGFAERRCLNAGGEMVLAIEDGEGRLVPDVRGSTFSVPSWIELPAFLEPHLAARNAVTTTGLPYEIESVMHFSNGGGVYLGKDLSTGRRVVLKEARPHAGLDAAGRDAVARLEHERDILRRLAGLESVPALLDHFTIGEHHFLVEEFVDGNPLQRLLVHRYPLTRTDLAPDALAGYTEWALDMVAKVERAVGSLHERGVVFGDLHPNNILVTDEGRLVLIDFEVATLAEDRARPALGHPAYAAPSDRLGTASDQYALACLRLGMFAPQTTIMVPMHRGKARHLARLVTETFPVPPAVVEEAAHTIADDRDMAEPPDPGDWPEIRDALRRAVLASATPDRDDRLFPGDVAQFRPGGGLNLAHGAAGVLHALAETGAGRFPEHEDWLRKRAVTPRSGTALGFYDGLHGVAHVLERLGHRQDALDVMDICLRERWEGLGLGLYSGLAGIGLNLLHLGETTGEGKLLDKAYEIVHACAGRLGGADDVPDVSGGSNPRAGLMFGSSGPALLFLHAYERTGDAALLELARVALRQDLRRCVRAADGSLQVDQGWRHLPYLDEGSVGISLVLARYLTHHPDEGLSRDLDDLLAVTRSAYFVQPGLFTGRAGVIASLAMIRRSDPGLGAQIRGLRWHTLPYGEGVAFPGDQLLRLSMDFSTGTAGVLFALGAALHEEPVFLPFSQPPGQRLPSERSWKEV